MIWRLARLRKALEVQRAYLSEYEKPSEPVAYETLRTLDYLFMRDLMEPERSVDKIDQQFRMISSWGVNPALRRILPRVPLSRPFRDFPSQPPDKRKRTTSSSTVPRLAFQNASRDGFARVF